MGMRQSHSLDATKKIQSIVLSCEDLHFLLICILASCAVIRGENIVAVVAAGVRYLKGLSMADLIGVFNGPVHTLRLLIVR